MSLADIDGKPVFSKEVKEKLIGKKEKERTILHIFQEHNKNAKKLISIDFAPDTVQRYETTYMHVYSFIKWQYRKEDLPLSEINQFFVKQFELYLKTERHCSHNTTIKYIKNFKKIVRIAIANNWLNKDPFVSIKYRLKPVDAVFLTVEELERIRTKKIEIERIDEVRDIFLFCCYTGLAFSDVKTLSFTHLSQDEDGVMWIHKKRKKTKQMSTILVLTVAKEIMNKYQGHPITCQKQVLLPVRSNQKMNMYLKEIADICGISKNLTTHVARHTFATTVALENDIPLEVVSKSLGHADTKMTQRYARITEKLIKKHMLKVDPLF